MARSASRDKLEQLTSMTKCAMCLDVYTDPRILPCVHTYCLKCIRAFCRDKHPEDKVECPLCRNKFEIPQNGVDCLRKNFLVESMKNVADTLSRSTGCEVCGLDQSKPDKKSAIMFCRECNQRMCKKCVNSHGRFKGMRKHQLVKIFKGEKTGALSAKLAINYCDKHPAETLNRYCLDCKAAIGVACYVESHKSHNCLDINKVTDEFREQVRIDVQDLGETISACRKYMIEEQKINKAKFSTTLSTIEHQIRVRAKWLTKKINTEKESLLKEVKSCRTDGVKQIDHVIGEIEQHVLFAERLVEYADELANRGTAGDVTQQACDVHNRAVELMRLESVRHALRALGYMDVTFTPKTWRRSPVDT